MTQPNSAKCQICDRVLSVHERAVGATCRLPQCKHIALRRELATQAKVKADLVAKVHRYRDFVFRERKCRQECPDAVILPANTRAIQSLQGKRIRLFRDRLMRQISVAMVMRYKVRALSRKQQVNEEHESNSSTIVASACATCQGDCCAQGEEHAFIQPETILRYMKIFPDLRPIEILAKYMACLPAKTYTGSCVYHGQKGCGLPREMRASLCNDYQCGELNGLCHHVGNSSCSTVFLVSVKHGKIVRGSLIDSDTGESRWKSSSIEKSSLMSVESPGSTETKSRKQG